MATINSIGTSSRDYSTLQSWEDAIPATPTGGYIGECYNDSEFTAGVTIAGHTTSATDYIELTCADGESFQDDAGAATNPLYYDQSLGVGIYLNNTNTKAIVIQNDYVYVDRLQVHADDCFGDYTIGFYTGTNSRITNLILLDTPGTNSGQRFVSFSSGGYISNSMFIRATPSANQHVEFFGSNGAFYNCGFVGLAAGGFITEKDDPAFVNCYFFGWDDITDADPVSLDYCATDLSGVLSGTGNLQGLTASDQFESATVDFRLKSGNSMAAGQRQATYTSDLDIVGQSRSTSTPCIGAWEYIAVNVGPAGLRAQIVRTR